jgi:hypothetical protein
MNKEKQNPETKVLDIIPTASGVNISIPENITKKRQTIVTKSISRTIQTQQYFSLTIQHTAVDCIEWETLEEREKKQDNLTKLAVKNFIQTHDSVLDQLKLGQMHAFVTDHISKKTTKKAEEFNKEINFDQLDEVS